MRSKLVLAALIFLTSFPALAQVAPAVRIKALPIGVGGGLSDYDVDYGNRLRMIGASAWLDYNLFKGFGIEAEGTSIFAAKPSQLQRMQQNTIKGGVIYKARPFFGLHPYAKGLYGLASIDFPSHNPLYYHDDFSMWAAGGGVEYKIWHSVYARADYEYEAYHQYLGPRTLNPQGFTIGATYYLRGIHRHL
jgi:opacity protein-like surface antigen